MRRNSPRHGHVESLKIRNLRLRVATKHMRSDVDGVIDENSNYFLYFISVAKNAQNLQDFNTNAILLCTESQWLPLRLVENLINILGFEFKVCNSVLDCSTTSSTINRSIQRTAMALIQTTFIPNHCYCKTTKTSFGEEKWRKKRSSSGTKRKNTVATFRRALTRVYRLEDVEFEL